MFRSWPGSWSGQGTKSRCSPPFPVARVSGRRLACPSGPVCSLAQQRFHSPRPPSPYGWPAGYGRSSSVSSTTSSTCTSLWLPILPLTVLEYSNTVNVGTFHACRNRQHLYRMSRPVIKRWRSRLHGSIAVSPAAMRYVSEAFPGEYEIIPNGIDVDHFSQRAVPWPQYQDGKTNLIFVGRLGKAKGTSIPAGSLRKAEVGCAGPPPHCGGAGHTR